MEFILSENAAPPGGHYSQAVKHNGLLYLSGIIPIDKNGNHIDVNDFEKQAKQVLVNAVAILKEAGCSKNDVLKASVYVADIANWPDFNRIYAEFFGVHKPARCVVPVPDLHYGFGVEVEMIAACD